MSKIEVHARFLSLVRMQFHSSKPAIGRCDHTRLRRVAVAFFIAAWVITPGSISNGKNISLSKLYSREELAKILIPRTEWHPFPKAAERAAWNTLPQQVRRRFINLAEEYLHQDIPNLPAALYLEYKRIGNRSNYQGGWLERRKMLHCLALAECMEGKGRFLDAVANLVWAKSFRSLGRMLYRLFNLSNLLAAAPRPSSLVSRLSYLVRDVWLGDEDMQMIAARDKDRRNRQLACLDSLSSKRGIGHCLGTNLQTR